VIEVLSYHKLTSVDYDIQRHNETGLACLVVDDALKIAFGSTGDLKEFVDAVKELEIANDVFASETDEVSTTTNLEGTN